MKTPPRRVYLDYASTTPVSAEAQKAMKPFFAHAFHNPSALYKEGVEAKEYLQKFRKTIAALLSAHSDEVIFTGSGTEADNLAILGVFEAARKSVRRPHVIISAIEHPAILELTAEIERRGGSVSIIAVLPSGVVDLSALRKALSNQTVLVSIMYANNEIGTINPIRGIAKIIRDFHKQKSRPSPYPYFHSDASQAANYLSLNTQSLGIDLMTLDASKTYGPKGIGLLWIHRRVAIEPIIFGGGQERGLRSGTEHMASIAGFAAALAEVIRIQEREVKRLLKLQEKLIEGLLALFPGARLNGDRKNRLPNNVNICFPGIDGELAVLRADKHGILCSSASSCLTLSDRSESYVISALGNLKCADSSLRFSLGRHTTTADIGFVLKKMRAIIEQSLRS